MVHYDRPLHEIHAHISRVPSALSVTLYKRYKTLMPHIMIEFALLF